MNIQAIEQDFATRIAAIDTEAANATEKRKGQLAIEKRTLQAQLDFIKLQAIPPKGPPKTKADEVKK